MDGPFSKPKTAIAVLFRGEPFRNGASCGCDADGCRATSRFLQSTFESYKSQLVQPLARRGLAVGIFLSLNLRNYPTENHASLLRRTLELAPQPVVAHEVSVAATQTEGLRRAVAFYRNLTAHAAMRRYESVIITRFDLRLSRSVSDWACDLTAPKLHLLAACPGARMDANPTCVVDTLFAVHSSLLGQFSGVLHLEYPGCFSSPTLEAPPGVARSLLKTGHRCWVPMLEAVGGRDRIGLCVAATRGALAAATQGFNGASNAVPVASQFVAIMRVFRFNACDVSEP